MRLAEVTLVDAPTIWHGRRGRRAGLRCAVRLLVVLAAIVLGTPGVAQQTSPPAGAVISAGVPAKHWAQAAAANQVRIIENDGSVPLRYTVRKVDAKGEVEREVIETKDGSVARLIKKNGQPLSTDEDAAERDRLKEILQSPEAYAKRHRRDSPARDYAINLVRQMPVAMIYSYTPGQPQPGGVASRQIVLDFKPDPAYHPPDMVSEALTGLSGRVCIDAQSQTVTRIEGQVLHAVNFGWGIVARIYPGGSVELEQQNLSGNIWVYSKLNEHLKIREMMVKTQDENAQMQTYDFRVLPSPLSLQEAVNTLLAMQIPLR
jgi:hypothetical protein